MPNLEIDVGAGLEEGAVVDSIRVEAATRDTSRVQLVDYLSGTPICPTSFSIVTDVGITPLAVDKGGVMQLAASEVHNGRYWRYDVPTLGGARSFDAAWSEYPLDWVNGKLPLPYYGGIEGLVYSSDAAPLDGAKVSLYLISEDNLNLLKTRIQADYPVHILNSLPMLLVHYEARVGDYLQVDEGSSNGGAYRVLSPACGRVLAHAWMRDRKGRTETVDIVPGSWTTLHFLLQGRPVLYGRVLDHRKKPMPDVEVKITVVCDSFQPDMSMHDREGGMGLFEVHESPSAIPVFGFKISTRTNAKGEYRITVPAGTGYAAGVSTIDSYGFSTLEKVEALEGTDLSLDVELDAPNLFPIVVEFEGGIALPGARVVCSVPDDWPWRRQFPEQESDSKGTIYCPWISDSMDYTFVVFSSQLREGRFTVTQPGGREAITVPLTAKAESPASKEGGD